VVFCQLKAVAISVGEQGFFLVFSILPDGPDGMDDVFRRQLAAGGDDGFAGGAATLAVADGAAFFEDGRAAGAVDGAVDAATAEQRAVGRVDDGVGWHFCDVALEEVNAGRH